MALHPITGLRHLLRATLSEEGKAQVFRWLERLEIWSLDAAIREQGLCELQRRLEQIVPDLSQQYTSDHLDSKYLLLKVRGLHAFQVALASEAIQLMDDAKAPLTLVDIGDSAGTHLTYLQALHKERKLRCVSVNVDEEAVRKIKGKGMEAVCAPAEDLVARGLNADIYLSFEMLEHLWNPIRALRRLSEHTNCRALVITVPYVSESRMGLHHIRGDRRQVHNPESTHIFELCPADWRLLFTHAGWSIRRQRLYLQYPRQGPLRVTKGVWKSLDFEGFWGAILERDHTWSSLYVGGE